MAAHIIMMALTETISFGLLVAKTLIPISALSIKVWPSLSALCLTGLNLVTDIKDGKKTSVKASPTITPLLAKIPRSATGATPEKEKDHNPTAVVIEVMIIAKPECPIAYLMDFFVSLVDAKSL